MGKRTRQSRRVAPPPAPSSPWWLLAVVAVGAVAVATGAWFVLRSGQSENATLASVAPASATAAPVQVAGVELAQPHADRGRIALNTPVRQEWRLRNVGATEVSLGKPKIEVLDGC